MTYFAIIMVDWKIIPVFEVTDQDSGHVYKVYYDGRVEGFPKSSAILNRITLFCGNYLHTKDSNSTTVHKPITSL